MVDMDPEFAAGIAAVQSPVFAVPPTIPDLRGYVNKNIIEPFKAYLEPSLPPASTYIVKDEAVRVDDGEFSVRYIVPIVEDESEKFPVLVHFHGGGFTLCNVDLDDYHLRILSAELKLSIVNVEYRLAPEHRFPAAVDDCVAALKWAVNNAALLKADLQKGFLVAGHAAGANLTAVVTHIVRDDPFFAKTPLTGQLVREPFVIHPDVCPESLKAELKSMEENKNVPPLNREEIDTMLGFYGAPFSDPRLSPLLYPSHSGLPRAFLHAMQLDMFRDHAVVYEKALREAGVETRLVVFPGVSHGFHYNLPGIKAAVKVRESVLEGLKWLLNRE